MRNIDKGSIWILLAALSAIFSYLTIVFGHFPYLGIAISLATFSSLVFFFKSNKSSFNLVLYLLTLIFSFFIFYRANGFLIFLDTLSIFFLGSLIAFPRREESDFGFLHFLISPFTLFSRSLQTKSDYELNLKSLAKDNIQIKREGIAEIVKSLIMSSVILLVIVPLLASANPLFNKLVTDFIEIFNLQSLLEKLFSADYFVWLVRTGAFLILAFFIPRLLTYINTKAPELQKIPNLLSSFNLLIPKILVGLVIFIFFVTQAQIYFATDETLLSLGYTHSQYAREVFAQLSIVALVILGLIYNDKSKKTSSTILTYVLVLEGIFLTFIALKSVYDYSSNWGFTYKRLWGYTGVFWILGVFSFFLYKYFKDVKNTYFVKGVILFSGLVLVGVNLANFDSLIFNYRKSVTHKGVDYIYLSGISSDAQSYGEHLQILENKMNGIDKDSNEYYLVAPAAWRVLNNIDKLQRKYKDLDLRTLNLAEYLQFQKIKSIDTQKYHKLWQIEPSSFTPYPGDQPQVIIREEPIEPVTPNYVELEVR